jgi:hypothetical protein
VLTTGSSYLYVEWRTGLGALPDFESGFVDALERVDGGGMQVFDVSQGHLRAHLVLLAYPSSAHNHPQLPELVRSACLRHEPSPSRLGIVACGRSDVEVSGSNLLAAVPACHQHEWTQVLDPGSLAETVEAWLLNIGRRLALQSPERGLPTHSPGLGMNSEGRDLHQWMY